MAQSAYLAGRNDYTGPIVLQALLAVESKGDNYELCEFQACKSRRAGVGIRKE